jgi:hypothetical protein
MFKSKDGSVNYGPKLNHNKNSVHRLKGINFITKLRKVQQNVVYVKKLIKIMKQVNYMSQC